MMKVGLVLIFMLSIGFVYRAFDIWQQKNISELKNITAQKEIQELHLALNELKNLPEGKVDSFENNYKNLDKQTRLFSRFHNLKMSFDTDNPNKNDLISQSTLKSKWLGIEQMVFNIHFYDLKNVDQCITVLQFLEELEESAPLKIFDIIQKGNQIEVKFQLYGRQI